MIKKLEINGVHTVLDADLKKYITKKIGRLDRFFPKNARESAHAEVFVKEIKQKGAKQCVCEVILHLPKGTIIIKEGTLNMFAAVDIVETKLKNQIKKYKDTHGTRGLHRRVLARFQLRGEI